MANERSYPEREGQRSAGSRPPPRGRDDERNREREGSRERESYRWRDPFEQEYDERFRGEHEWDFEGSRQPGGYQPYQPYEEGRYGERRPSGAEQYERFGGWDRPQQRERWSERGAHAGGPYGQRSPTYAERDAYGERAGGWYGGSGERSERYGRSEVYGGTPSSNRGLRQLGRYAGRGPKGYQRSDERLKEEVCDRLTADGEIDASGLTVTVREGEVTLEGNVPERRMKRDAEDCAESISGVRQVHNRLRVESQEADERGGAASSAGRSRTSL